MVETERLLTTAEAAKMIGRTVATVNRWAIDGRLPVAQKLPGTTGANLFRPVDVRRLLTDAAAEAQPA